MSTHNILAFYGELAKVIFQSYHQIPPNSHRTCSSGIRFRFQVTISPKRLSCYIQPIFESYGFSKQEQLSLRPRIILIYDVINQNEASVLSKYAKTGFQVHEIYHFVF